MSFANDEELLRLKNSLNTLTNLVKELHLEEKPYFLKLLDRMKTNIETYICIEKMQKTELEDEEYLEAILRRDWIEANRNDMGIPAYEGVLTEKMDAEKLSRLSYITLLVEIEQDLSDERENTGAFQGGLVYNKKRK